MANLSVTLECNRHCSYCFARASFHNAETKYMSRGMFLRALEFLKRSGIDQVRLLGGEPTLHPDFEWLVARTLKEGFRLLVFSNGLMPATALRCLEAVPPKRVSVLVNVNSAREREPHETERQAEALARLRQRVVIGFNIHRPAPGLDFLLPLVEKHGLSSSVRLGLAHPRLHDSNTYLRPKDYAPAGQCVAEFVQKAEEKGVTVEFDCGFVPCMFPDGFLEEMGVAPEAIGLRCGPVPDILPDGSVVPCYPLASASCLSLADKSRASDIRSRFEKRMQPYRAPGIFRECATCPLRTAHRCLGGCLAAAMQRLRHASFTVALPENTAPAQRPERCIARSMPTEKSASTVSQADEFDPPVGLWVVPYVDQPMDFWQRLRHDFGECIRSVYFPLPGGVIGSGRPSQPAKHLNEFLRRSPFPCTVLINPLTLPQPVDEIAPLMIESLRRLDGECRLAGATVSNLLVASRIHEQLPELPLTASVLMDISRPNQAVMVEDVCQALVPASRIMRDLPSLRAVRAAFAGRLRLIVNEACLPGCPFRVQHFHEMGSGFPRPRSLCRELLKRQPWMRLTGAWVLPQHLHFYEGIYDELKLAGRVTLRNPALYRRVLDAYVHGRSLPPNEIGGGPASILDPIEISEEFYAQTLRCGHRCDTCQLCRDYYEAAMSRLQTSGERLPQDVPDDTPATSKEAKNSEGRKT